MTAPSDAPTYGSRQPAGSTRCRDSLEPRPAPRPATCSATSPSSGPATRASGPRTTSSRRSVAADRDARAEIAGFGASGRNGGWCSALFAVEPQHGSPASTAATAAIAMQRAMFDTVDEVGKVCADEGIDCHFAKGGTTHLATNAAHVGRLRAEVDEARALGFADDDVRWLDATAARDRIDVDGAARRGATPRTARPSIRPGSRGASPTSSSAPASSLYEQTRGAGDRPGHVAHRARHRPSRRRRPGDRGRHRDAPRRRAARSRPLYSLMVATEPLPDRGLGRARLDRPRRRFNDGRHLIIYGQRTADDRIAFGGRGAPYHFGSAIRSDFDRDESVFVDLRRVLGELVPQTERRAHHPRVGRSARRAARLAPVGAASTGDAGWRGPAGTSATACRPRTSPAARSPTSSRAPTPRLTQLPWVQHRSRRWEPEPLRWLGHRALTGLARSADRVERRTGRPAKRIAVLEKILGA